MLLMLGADAGGTVARGVLFSLSFYLSLCVSLSFSATEKMKRLMITNFRLSSRHGFCGVILHKMIALLQYDPKRVGGFFSFVRVIIAPSLRMHGDALATS